LRKRLNYPELKRAVEEQRRAFGASYVLIEDKASGTQLIQELRFACCYGITPYEPKCDKILRMDAASNMIENGFAYLPEAAPWLGDLLSELMAFPKSRHDDQVDSISQALDWIKQRLSGSYDGVVEYYKREAEKILNGVS
jgi:predicted phage terminase large subunit-like protein